MMKNKKILEFCLSPDLGGLELFMVNCYRSFHEKTETKVIVQENTKLDKYLEKEDKYYIKRNKIFPFIGAYKLAKYIDKEEIDVVHFHWTKDIATVVLAKVFSQRKPKIVQTRNMTMTRFKDDVYHRWLYKNVDMMHAVTHQVKDQIERFVPADIRPEVSVVYMGTEEKEIDVKRVDRLKKSYGLEDEFVVGIVGRIEEGKGQYIVLEALAQLKELNIKVMIVGHTMDDAYLQSLKDKIVKLEIKDKVIFTGFTKEVDAHMRLFDVNVLATKRETFGLVVIEAMVNKVCMVATNAGGPLEIIEDGVDGLLFNRSSGDLAEKINLLYTNIEHKEKLSILGYEKILKIFNSKKQNEKLLNEIQRNLT